MLHISAHLQMLRFLLTHSILLTLAYSFSSQPELHNSIIEQLKVRPYYPKKLSWMKVIAISEHESHEHCLNTTKRNNYARLQSTILCFQ